MIFLLNLPTERISKKLLFFHKLFKKGREIIMGFEQLEGKKSLQEKREKINYFP